MTLEEFNVLRAALRTDVEAIAENASDKAIEKYRAAQDQVCKNHQDRMKSFCARLEDLEGNQKKALIGWGIASMGFAAAMSGVWAWLKTKLGW
jgi:Flp pilus assembly protein TadB